MNQFGSSLRATCERSPMGAPSPPPPAAPPHTRDGAQRSPRSRMTIEAQMAGTSSCELPRNHRESLSSYRRYLFTSRSHSPGGLYLETLGGVQTKQTVSRPPNMPPPPTRAGIHIFGGSTPNFEELLFPLAPRAQTGRGAFFAERTALCWSLARMVSRRKIVL